MLTRSMRVSTARRTRAVVVLAASAASPAALFDESFRRTDTTGMSGSRLIVVHRMWKVGSASIRHALDAHPQLRDRATVESTHVLSDERFRLERYRYTSKGLEPCVHLRASERVRRWIAEHDGPVCFISPFREPVARNLSHFFFKIVDRYPGWDFGSEIRLDRLVREFHASRVHGIPATWFTDEMLVPFGIDVFGEPFDHERGWQAYRSGRFSAVLLRTELDDRVKSEAIASHLGIDPFPIERVNQTDGPLVRPHYERFKREVRFDAGYLDLVLGSRFARHMFTRAELDAARQRWGTPEAAAA